MTPWNEDLLNAAKRRRPNPAKKQRKSQRTKKKARSSPTPAPPRPSAQERLPQELQRVNLNAAGIDVGATEHWVAIPEGRDERCVRSFGAFTADLHTLADWLEQCGVTTVAMESTGVYWIALLELLEVRGFEVKLVDPRGLKTVPGRKSDVLDCQWIQRLHTFGLLAGAFRPDDEICVLRSFMRERAMLVSYASFHIQHMQKAMTEMNIKLQHVVSDVTGTTGMRIIRAILTGERDPEKLAALRHPRCRKSPATIAKALEGNWRQDHLFKLKQAVELYDFYQAKIAECDEQIEAHLKSFEDRSEGKSLPPQRRQKRGPNAPNFDVREYLFQMTGVDLTAVDGLGGHTVLKVLSEIGTDMSRWPSGKHFASWLGVCPGSKISGGKKLSTRSKPCANRAAAALRFAASGLHNSRSYLGAFLRRKKAQLGAPKAITATAHKLARLIYSMLRYGTEYVDRGQDYYERTYRQRALANLRRNAKRFGFELTPSADAAATAAS